MAETQAGPPAEEGDVPSFRRASFGYLTNWVARLFARGLQAELEPLGLAPGQFPILLFLWEQEGLTQGELCRLVQVEQPTMANTLARMERDGLIDRHPDPADGRRSVIRLTAKGRSLKDPAIASARRVNDRAAEGLSGEERTALLRLLAKVAANLGGVQPGRKP